MTPHRSTGEWSLAVRQQASVARIGQLGLRGGELRDLLDEALLGVADTLGVQGVALFELLTGWHDLQGRAAVLGGAVVPSELVERVRVPGGSGSLPGYTVETGAAVVSSDLHHDERFRALAGDYGIEAQSAVTAPVGWGERPWGVLAVYGDGVRTWTDDDVHYVQSMANTVGLAIARQGVEHQLRDSSATLDLSLAAGGLGAWSWDVASDRMDLSASAHRIHGLAEGTFEGTGEAFLERVHPDDRLAVRGKVFEVLQTTGEHHDVYRIVRADTGDVRWVESWGRLVDAPGNPDRLVGVVSDITDRRQAEEVREALLGREHRARVEAEQARERLGLLAEASERFSSSLDPAVIVASLPEFCVPQLADGCAVDLFDDDGALVEAAAAAVDEATLADMRELRRRRAALGRVGGLWSETEVARTATSAFQPLITTDQLRAAASDEDHLELILRFGLRSSIVAPLVARDRVMGVVTVVINRPGRHYTEDHLTFVEELAARAALALDNGRLYESRNRVARSLQAALLPPALPQIDRLGLAARYRVAEGDIEIGGDFYDVVEVGERAWGVVVGDVCGRGPDAAALTGLVRHSVRTAVVRERAPSRVLALTNDAVLDQIDDDRFCTAAYLRVQLDESATAPIRVTASSAGHPRPAVLRADGRAELIDCAGLLLGVVPAPTLVDVELELEPGDAIVLYTDGVTEARRGRELFGEDRVVEALEAVAGSDAEAIAAGLEEAVSAYQDDASDDIAILVLQARAAAAVVGGTPAPGSRAAGSG